MGPTKPLKPGHRSYDIKIDIGLVFVLFADPTDRWQSVISSFFNFFFKKKNLRNHLKGFSVNDRLML